MKGALTQLQRELGDAVLVGKADCLAASMDSARLSFPPQAVVRIKSEEQVGMVLKLANRCGAPVTARGGGTATTGAASPVRGGWVLDFRGWNDIRIDATAGMAYVRPGATIAAIQQAAKRYGWFYPPDPSSLHYATIGGAIATNAGGLRAARYGVTRDYVYALEGFLPSGERVRWGMDVKKFASGYNIRDLWIGSEGTLGIVTSAVLKLIPAPVARQTFLAVFNDEGMALRAVQALLKTRLVPAVLEFLDRQTVACTLQRCGALPLLDDTTGALLLIEVDGSTDNVRAQSVTVKTWATKHTQRWRAAHSPAEGERLWSIRRQCSPAMFALGDTKLNEDVVVPLRSQVALLQFTEQLNGDLGLPTPTFGHAADGNFHVHLMFDWRNQEQRKQAERGVQALMEAVVTLGGAITGEHGIGLAKSPFLRLQHNAAEIAAMQAIKHALDPNNILNPGKLFEPFAIWQHEPARVRFPWERGTRS